MAYRIYLSPPHLSGNEHRYVAEAMASNWISSVGPMISAFEKALSNLHLQHQVALCNSGTAAIHLALKALDVQEGDYVLCSSFTFAGSAFPIQYQKAIPVFVDSEPQSWNMDPDLLEKAIADLSQKGKKPKAMILVHLYGNMAKLEPLLSIARRHGIPVIEDAAEALGSTWEGQAAGTFGTIGILSFNGNKIITTSGGGALLCRDQKLRDKCLHWANQAREKALHYEHLETGYNYRMSNILAAIGLGQLEMLTEKIAAKRKIFNVYQEELPSCSFHQEQKGEVSNRWLSCVLLPKGDPHKLTEVLQAAGIEARPLWKPMHLQPVFEGCPSYLNGTSERLYQTGICLPSGTSLTNEQQLEICEMVNRYLDAIM